MGHVEETTCKMPTQHKPWAASEEGLWFVMRVHAFRMYKHLFLE